MLGVLLTLTTTYVAASRTNIRRLDNLDLPRKLSGNVVVCEERAQAGNHRGVNGGRIMSRYYLGTRRDNDPGTCAAPRLLEQAAANGEDAEQIAQWAMSEVWYDPKQEDSTSYVHGLSAKHCGTCDRLVPLLLCPYL